MVAYNDNRRQCEGVDAITRHAPFVCKRGFRTQDFRLPKLSVEVVTPHPIRHRTLPNHPNPKAEVEVRHPAKGAVLHKQSYTPLPYKHIGQQNLYKVTATRHIMDNPEGYWTDENALEWMALCKIDLDELADLMMKAFS